MNEPSLFDEARLDALANGGVVAAAVLAVLLVAFSTYGRRFCRHPAVRFLVWGASMVFIPLSSAIISALLSRAKKVNCDGSMPPSGRKNPDAQNMWTLLLWIVLILTVKCNANISATAVTAVSASPADGDGSVDGQKIRPPVESLAEYGWLAYLIWLCVPVADWLGHLNIAIFIVFSGLGLVKLVLKLAAFHLASSSFALGKNARLIAGYMQQLVGDDGDDGQQQEQVPRYVVMGEKKKHVEEWPQGYRVKRESLDDKFSGLVTLDRVWRLAEHGDGILADRPELRDLCLSHSLFKILRRRLSGYPVAEAGSAEALEFVLRGMGSVGSGVDVDRVFRVLVDELCFASDFYYSPIPLCTFGGWCAALNYLCSVLLIIGAVAVGYIYQDKGVLHSAPYKVITFSLLLVLVLVEAWEIIAGLCSNWTKMGLLGHYISHQSMWRRWSCLHAALAAVLQLKTARRWRDKLGQHSVLEPRRFRRQTGLLSELLYGSSGLMKSIQVSPHVKDAVLRSLQSSYGHGGLSGNGSAAAPARRVVVRGRVDWARYGFQTSWAWADDGDRGTSITEEILTWHVGTRLFELRMKSTPASTDMIAACQLSYYCAYLVAVAPELLPDCAAWTKRRYKEVSDDVMRVAAVLGADGGGGSESMAEMYEQLVQVLSKDSGDTVLRRGAELGQHLVEAYENEESACPCEILVDFWSEMLLYVAPSENIKGHVQAMARGGEFITLVWALLFHAGVTTRPEPTPGGATAIPHLV